MMQHVFPTYNRFPFEIVSGNGFKLTDNKGMTYLDFTSGIGVCGLGYNVSKLNEAVEKQLGKVWHTSNLYESSLQESVAEKLGEAHGMIASFCNSGTEANEAAFKLARKATGKSEVLVSRQDLRLAFLDRKRRNQRRFWSARARSFFCQIQ